MTELTEAQLRKLYELCYTLTNMMQRAHSLYPDGRRPGVLYPRCSRHAHDGERPVAGPAMSLPRHDQVDV